MDALARFVEKGLESGHSKSELREALGAAGWSSDTVDEALARFSDVPFPIPVPRPRRTTSAKETFLYLVTFFSLYVTAIALCWVFFGIIDAFVPSTDYDYDYYGGLGDYSGLRWGMGAILVSLPMYLALYRRLARERGTSSIRRWLTYVTLFVAAVVATFWAIGLIMDLLGGEFIARSVLKSLAVLAVTGSVFAFYLHQMKLEEKTESV